MNRWTMQVAGLLLAAAAGVLVAAAIRPGLFDGRVERRVPDFGLYVTATALNFAGQNPYDPDRLADAERAAFPDAEVRPAVSPPWVFAAFAPFVAVDYPAARVAWLLATLGLLAGSGGVLWRLYGGAERLAWYGPLLAASGYASYQAIGLGQFSVMVLAGLAGFAWADRAGRPLAAGACLAALLVKPQNQLVLAAVGAAWIVLGRHWRVAVGAAAGTAVLTAAAAAPNPAVFSQYIESLADRPPAEERSPLPGPALRLLLAPDRFWLTFLPLAPGLAWAGWYFGRHRRAWDWADRMPPLALASLLASPHGWVYDHVVLLFPVVRVAADLCRRAGDTAVLYTGVGWIGLVMYYRVLIARGADEFHWVWVAPAIAAGYAWWQLTCTGGSLRRLDSRQARDGVGSAGFPQGSPRPRRGPE